MSLSSYDRQYFKTQNKTQLFINLGNTVTLLKTEEFEKEG